MSRDGDALTWSLLALALLLLALASLFPRSSRPFAPGDERFLCELGGVAALEGVPLHVLRPSGRGPVAATDGSAAGSAGDTASNPSPPPPTANSRSAGSPPDEAAAPTDAEDQAAAVRDPVVWRPLSRLIAALLPDRIVETTPDQALRVRRVGWALVVALALATGLLAFALGSGRTLALLAATLVPLVPAIGAGLDVLEGIPVLLASVFVVASVTLALLAAETDRAGLRVLLVVAATITAAAALASHETALGVPVAISSASLAAPRGRRVLAFAMSLPPLALAVAWPLVVSRATGGPVLDVLFPTLPSPRGAELGALLRATLGSLGLPLVALAAISAVALAAFPRVSLRAGGPFVGIGLLVGGLVPWVVSAGALAPGRPLAASAFGVALAPAAAALAALVAAEARGFRGRPALVAFGIVGLFALAFAGPRLRGGAGAPSPEPRARLAQRLFALTKEAKDAATLVVDARSLSPAVAPVLAELDLAAAMARRSPGPRIVTLVPGQRLPESVRHLAESGFRPEEDAVLVLANGEALAHPGAAPLRRAPQFLAPTEGRDASGVRHLSYALSNPFLLRSWTWRRPPVATLGRPRLETLSGDGEFPVFTAEPGTEMTFISPELGLEKGFVLDEIALVGAATSPVATAAPGKVAIYDASLTIPWWIGTIEPLPVPTAARRAVRIPPLGAANAPAPHRFRIGIVPGPAGTALEIHRIELALRPAR